MVAGVLDASEKRQEEKKSSNMDRAKPIALTDEQTVPDFTQYVSRYGQTRSQTYRLL
jgi:hypothetical protein